MNEKAIRVAYELFVADGYTRSIDDFKNLMRDNPEGREVAYNLFVNDGYNKSINDFSILMGATESLDETPQPTVKKKGMASPSEDGSLASSETDKAGTYIERPPTPTEEEIKNFQERTAYTIQHKDKHRYVCCSASIWNSNR
jgi:hypothetical protein